MIKSDLEKLIGQSVDRPKFEKWGDFCVRGRVEMDENELIEKIEEVAGFTNFYIKTDKLIKEAEKLNYETELMDELAKHGKAKTVVIDYSAPNIAKPFGIGHLRSTDIGQAIYNIYRILGWKCIGDNHLGDWGTQFGKLIVAIKKWTPVNSRIEDLTIDDLEQLYVKFHQESEKNETLIEEGRTWFEKLEKGDDEAMNIWKKSIEISLKEFNKIYDLLGVKIDYSLGESFYTDKMGAVIRELKQKKISSESQGAVIVEFDEMPPAMVTKTNETTTYFTRDMATIKYRLEQWHPEMMIYEVGVDQELHFRQVFEAAKKIGWKCEYVHVAHGLIRWKDGKFSTRQGKTIHLMEVVEEARERARKIAPQNDQAKIDAVAIGAIKFNDLAQDPRKDIVFDWDKVMSMDGNSGPYLQYTFARCLSVLNKTKIFETKNINQKPALIENEELILLRELTKFEEKLLEAAKRFNPAVVAEYLISVARKYNEFYGKFRIISQPEEVWRVFLTRSTSNVLRYGLEILGIKTIEKM